MDLSDVVSVRKFQEFSDAQKHELYETLLVLAEAIEEIPKKSLRKTLDISLAVLRHKGAQVLELQEQLDDKSSADESQHVRLLSENEKLKGMLNKLEEEKQSFRHKIKELSEDILHLQKRLQEAESGAHSDKDSSDPLSELDKQEELLKNINSKNKHIKRLLREIESLQTQNIEQSKAIIASEQQLQEAKSRILELSADITLLDGEHKALKETVNELHVEISRLEGNVTYLEEERERGEKDLKDFIDKLEAKALTWKQLLDEKEHELKKLRQKRATSKELENTIVQISKSEEESSKTDEDTARETTKLLHAIESRDKLIEQLELKIKTMAEEMLSSTKLMNKLSAERIDAQNPHKPRACCQQIEESLRSTNERCRELNEMLERTEEDNVLKSKQALQAITALDAYQRGEDGLVKSLRRCSSLETKLLSREKQIQALVMELNSMHEIAHENKILRKRLNIPDDVVIATKNLAAKERSKDKMIDRLTLKLRASEELRLQLKMEKSDMRKELICMQKTLQTAATVAITTAEESSDSAGGCPSEVGEIEESMRLESIPPKVICSTCRGEVVSSQSQKSTEKESFFDLENGRYQELIDENETLRLGMLEILEKLREYDASSDHITIDTEILLRVLQPLQRQCANTSPTTTTITLRLQNELEALKAREKALSELLQKQHTDVESVAETDELPSIQSAREDGEIRIEDSDLQMDVELPAVIDTSTRPTTPNKTLDQSLYPVIVMDESVVDLEGRAQLQTEQLRELQLQNCELQVYRQRYEELRLHMGATDDELRDYCKQLVSRATELELSFKKQSQSFKYLREDFDRALTESKHNEIKHIEQEAELKRELVVLTLKNSEMQETLSIGKNKRQYSVEEYRALQRSNAELQTQIAYMLEHIMAGKMTVQELKIPDICTDYGIIRENLQLDYLTIEEYEKLQEEAQKTMQRGTQLERKCTQLEGLLEIAHEQILSQQKLLNEITDNHVNLRHLVADLQSSAEDKLIMAKTQRDLDSAKAEVGNLKMTNEQLQQKYNSLEMDIQAKEQMTAQNNEYFQIERRLNATKLKFLKKSIFTLKEKYAKFTPLIFLTNYVFSYTKFTKEMTEKASGKESLLSERLRQDIEQLIAENVREFKGNQDESQHLIKLIKQEMQNKFLEEQLDTLQRKHKDLQQELTEQRIKYANDTEHWKTIEALFGPELTKDSPENQTSSTNGDSNIKSNMPTSDIDNNDINNDTNNDTLNSNIRYIDAATNTDAPIPTERKLSGTSTRQKSQVELIDKNMSPIASPAKGNTKQQRLVVETMTQTESVAVALVNPKPLQEELKVVESLRVDATVQTSLEKLTESLGVQTAIEEVNEEEISKEPIPDSEEFEEIQIELKAAKALAEELSQSLKTTNEELNKANAVIEELRKQIECFKHDDKQSSEQSKQQEQNQQSGIIEKTILSFHTLLSEKDKSISKYQDLLQTEREQMQTTSTKLRQEIDGLKNTINNLNYNIKSKDMEILELKTKLETVSVRKNSKEKLDIATVGGVGAVGSGEDSGDNSLNEISDEKIEEMFELDTSPNGSASQVPMITINEVTEEEEDNDEQSVEEEKQDTEILKENPALLKQIKELNDKAAYCEGALKIKEEEVGLLREKLQLYQERDRSLEQSGKPEMEQLRLLLDEKDKHINELMSTLNNFHDDQQRYINDSTHTSADQISKLAADLTRTEATNKIYHTQVEALRRQLTSLTQREKQARELSQSLRTQLIKRPVVSIKTELNARVKNEQLQKRIQQLELDLEDARAQIQRQTLMIETKRVKTSTEVSLWEKQKRWQQSAEKCKAKLEETECTLEKTRALLQSARNAVSRLEKDKQLLELKLTRATQVTAAYGKCCRTPSCPNLHAKYTPSESPETYTGGSSECSSPAQSANSAPALHNYYGGAQQHQGELLEALKARIEMQQRKILAMELEGKGSNALTTELERLQEKYAGCEAHNIRLEARNLQLQLDNDLLRQGDHTERLQKRIKHLEDYIIALKEELAQTAARRELCKCSGGGGGGNKMRSATSAPTSGAEQTILSLRGIVEKLRAENKYLKDGRRSSESRSSSSVDTPRELLRLQQLHATAQEQMAALQMQLSNAQSMCAACGKRETPDKYAANSDELSYIKQQLHKKTQLLQKAKVLLTRAAAKEKVLKEQLTLWKRKCSELQNVPVIDEISE